MGINEYKTVLLTMYDQLKTGKAFFKVELIWIHVYVGKFSEVIVTVLIIMLQHRLLLNNNLLIIISYYY